MPQSSNACETAHHRAGELSRIRASEPSEVRPLPRQWRSRCPYRCRARSARTRCARDELPDGRDALRLPPRRGGAARLRDCRTRSASSWLAPERLADQITSAERDEQRSGGVFLDLLFNAFLELVEIRIAQPVGARLHSAGE